MMGDTGLLRIFPIPLLEYIMKILVIDRDEVSSNLIKARLTPVGHAVTIQPVKAEGVDAIAREGFDVVLMDPSPITNPRPTAVNIRRAISRMYPYLVLMSSTLTRQEAIVAGMNDVLAKPVDPAELDQKLDQAQRLTGLIKRISDNREDFPSAGGVIAKSAFNQLFLSAIDRADRYGEKSYVLFIGLKNYLAIRDKEGQHAADFAAAKMAQHLVRLRRQSDIIAQTAKSEYALLLQRPIYETEPVEAANRFAEALYKCTDIQANPLVEIEISIDLIDLPVGSSVVEHTVRLNQA